MKLIENLDERQLKLCQKANVIIEDKEYSMGELYEFEQRLLEYLNLYGIDDEDEVTELGEEYEEIIDILVDFEDEQNPETSNVKDFVEEADRVKLKDGRTGVLADITENMYTIEIDEEYRTGNVDDDILIVEATEIVEFTKPTESIEDLEDENRNNIEEED